MASFCLIVDPSSRRMSYPLSQRTGALGQSGLIHDSLCCKTGEQSEKRHTESLEFARAKKSGPASLDGPGRLVRDGWNLLAPWCEKDQLRPTVRWIWTTLDVARLFELLDGLSHRLLANV